MRNLIICSALLCFSITSYAQKMKLGIQMSPGLSSSRIVSKPVTPVDSYISDNGSKLSFRFGPIADFALTETYFFTTGILFSSKSVAISYNDDIAPVILVEEYKLQYLQLPIALKLYTNEISLDTRIFVSMGLMTEINISEKQVDNYITPLITDFTFFDASLFIGGGVEYAIGTNTSIYGGVSYNRGLFNSISDVRVVRGDDLKIFNDLINLDIGVKF
ncbi:MAG: PorT family protein [Cyclobacteriaceae bacterium]|nr:PorT family protein [Cyclobacteriaceae bacterium]